MGVQMRSIRNGIEPDTLSDSNQRPHSSEKQDLAGAMAAIKNIEISKFHKILGHASEEITKDSQRIRCQQKIKNYVHMRNSMEKRQIN